MIVKMTYLLFKLSISVTGVIQLLILLIIYYYLLENHQFHTTLFNLKFLNIFNFGFRIIV